MTLTVKLFAGARQAVGHAQVAVEIESPATIADLRRKLAAEYPALAGLLQSTRFAVDDHYAEESQGVTERSEIALIPPVSGGYESAIAPANARARS